MGWPPALSCGGDTSDVQWNQGNPPSATRASEQSWAWLVHKYGDFQAFLDFWIFQTKYFYFSLISDQCWFRLLWFTVLECTMTPVDVISIRQRIR